MTDNKIGKLVERLLVDMMCRPYRWAFGLFFSGFACGILVVVLIHFIWLNTVFQNRIEQELNRQHQVLSKELVYQVYAQRTCVAKWKMTSNCVEWTK